MPQGSRLMCDDAWSESRRAPSPPPTAATWLCDHAWEPSTHGRRACQHRRQEPRADATRVVRRVARLLRGSLRREPLRAHGLDTRDMTVDVTFEKAQEPARLADLVSCTCPRPGVTSVNRRSVASRSTAPYRNDRHHVAHPLRHPGQPRPGRPHRLMRVCLRSSGKPRARLSRLLDCLGSRRTHGALHTLHRRVSSAADEPPQTDARSGKPRRVYAVGPPSTRRKPCREVS